LTQKGQWRSEFIIFDTSCGEHRGFLTSIKESGIQLEKPCVEGEADKLPRVRDTLKIVAESVELLSNMNIGKIR